MDRPDRHLRRKSEVKLRTLQGNMVKDIDRILCPTGRKPHATGMYLHFDNSPIHKTPIIAQTIADCHFRRLDHSAHSSDLAPCDFFFLVTCMKNVRVSVRDGGGIGREDHDGYRGHPEVPMDCDFSKVIKERPLRVTFLSTFSVRGYLFDRSRVRRLNGYPRACGNL
jgi:hypothetical protein